MERARIESVGSVEALGSILSGRRTPPHTPHPYDREKGQDRRGGLRLAADLARADAVKDTVEISDEAWSRRQAEEFVANHGVMERETEIGFLSLAFQQAILRGYMQGANSVLDKFAAARRAENPKDPHETRERAANVAPAPGFIASDTGAGAVSTAAPASGFAEEPERFDEATGPMPEPEKCPVYARGRLCGNAHCVECEHVRQEERDDAAMRADLARERRDSEV